MGSTGTLYNRGNRFRYLNTAATTVIRDTETRLVRIVVNDIDTSGLIDVFNGITIAGEQIAAIGAGVAQDTGVYEYDVALSGGLTVVLTNNPDVTVVFQ